MYEVCECMRCVSERASERVSDCASECECG